MNKMYRKSKIWISQAKDALKHVSKDDIYIDMACYNTQQAIEFILKAILQENKVMYEKTHDIAFLLNLVDGTGFTFDKRDSLDLLADTITDWEQQSRYGDGIKTSVQTIQRVHNIYKNIETKYTEVIEVSDSIQNKENNFIR